MKFSIKQYFWNIWISIDQFGNVLLGGDPDETISSRSGKTEHKSRVAYWLCRALHLLDPNHCKDAIEHDEGKEAAWKEKQ